jgi:hypothetical protein
MSAVLLARVRTFDGAVADRRASRLPFPAIYHLVLDSTAMDFDPCVEIHRPGGGVAGPRGRPGLGERPRGIGNLNPGSTVRGRKRGLKY